MNKRTSIGKNAILNATKAALSVLFPLITYPYALRILGASNIGKVSYISSIISYFAIVAAIGIGAYGVREGAKIRDNEVELQEFVSEVFTINVISTLITYICLAAFSFIFLDNKEYAILMLVLSTSILFTTFGVDWINALFEDYFFITVRSIVIHLVAMIFLFVLVRNKDDYYIYAMLQILPNAIVCVSSWIYCKKYVKVRITKSCKPNIHLKPMLVMLAGTITTSIYVNSDITMLGVFANDYNVGLYTASTKIYTVVKNILAAVYSVAVPALSFNIGAHNWKKSKELYSNIFGGISIILLPAVIGMFLLSSELMRVMGGSEYVEASISLKVLSLALLFAIYGGLITACLNIALGREKENLISAVISALINIVLNLIFIPVFGINGAAITTVLSEAFVLVFCLTRVPEKSRYMDTAFIFREIRNALIGCTCMGCFVIVAKFLVSNMAIKVIACVAGGATIYFIVELFLRDVIVLKYTQSIYNKRRNQ